MIHVPHASRAIPPEVRRGIVLDDRELERELDDLVDHFADQLVAGALPGARRVVCPVGRLVADVERFEDDRNEPMAARGQGAVYIRSSRGLPLRAELAESRRETILARYYRPHHARLEAAVERALDRHGRALVIDVHSFPDRPLPVDLDQSPDRPDICFGTDPYHTPWALVREAVRLAGDLGWRSAVNRPYAGSMVPLRYYRNSMAVASIMVEVNRRLYVDYGTSPVRRGSDFADVTRRVSALVEGIFAAWRAASEPG